MNGKSNSTKQEIEEAKKKKALIVKSQQIVKK